jgi:hypothetical protein
MTFGVVLLQKLVKLNGLLQHRMECILGEQLGVQQYLLLLCLCNLRAVQWFLLISE